MCKKIIKLISLILLITGLVLLLFPTVSNSVGTAIVNEQTETFDNQATNAIDSISFKEAIENKIIDNEGYPIDEKGKRTSNQKVVFEVDIQRLYEDSIKYNNNLIDNQSINFSGKNAFAYPVLDLKSYGIMDGIYGYVSAPTIGMKLPIYLGASDVNMSYGVGHLTYTSLPIGGTNTNTVLAGHTGYIGRVFFDNLRNLAIGDKVTLRNYWTNLEYKVVETKVCKPNEIDNIVIQEDKDLLTMFTCTPNNNGGFDRYYVICERH